MPQTKAPTISFEIFPPKNDAAAEKLWDAVRQLSFLKPSFVSVTCGAGGSAADGTSKTVHHVRSQFGLDVVPHMATARAARSHIRTQLQVYKLAGVRHVVAIRGDAAPDQEDFGDDIYPNTVDFVAELHDEFKLDPFVAAYPDVHPRALSPQQDLDHLKRKVEAGATLAISQFFFMAETFLRFRDKMKAVGIQVPLAAGIMPIHSLAQVVKFAKGCGTVVPEGFAARFERHGSNPAALFEEGVAHAVELCSQLRKEGVEHFHFYTLNHGEMPQMICRNPAFGMRHLGNRNEENSSSSAKC